MILLKIGQRVKNMLKGDKKSCGQAPVCINRRQRGTSRWHPTITLVCYYSQLTLYPTMKNLEKYLLPENFPCLNLRTAKNGFKLRAFCMSFANLKSRITSKNLFESALGRLFLCFSYVKNGNIWLAGYFWFGFFWGFLL